MAQTKPIRIVVLHEDPFARAGLLATFAKYPDLEMVGIDEGMQLSLPTPRQLARDAVDVAVADYACGVHLAPQKIRHLSSGAQYRVMIVASIDREWEIRCALEHGVRGYVLFGYPLDEIASGVRDVHRGNRHISSNVALRLAESLSGEALTGREEEVLRLVVEGMGNKAIARRLGIAVGTVKSHLKEIFDKLNVESRTQAICVTKRRGLLCPTEDTAPLTIAQSTRIDSNIPSARIESTAKRASLSV